MTPHDLLDRAIGKFEDVLDVLGFARPEGSNIKNRRACALCGATNKTTFSYRPDAGIWRCFRGSRRDSLRRLRDDRSRHYVSENASSAVARTLLAETGGKGDDEPWGHIFNHARDDDRADQIDREIQRIERATPAELVSSTHAWEVA